MPPASVSSPSVLARGPNFEHLRPALGALALGSRTAVLHRDLDGVFHFTLGLAFHTVRFSCHVRFLSRPVPAMDGLPGWGPYSQACPTFPLVATRESHPGGRDTLSAGRPPSERGSGGETGVATPRNLRIAASAATPSGGFRRALGRGRTRRIEKAVRCDRRNARSDRIRPRQRQTFRARTRRVWLLRPLRGRSRDRRSGTRRSARRRCADDRRARRRT
jgi:hypothetical protein